MNPSPLIAGVELGGTKSIAVIAQGANIFAEERWQTGEPNETLGRIADWIAAAAPGPVTALGLASFGPLGLNPGQADYGCITSTPKPGWSETPVLDLFASRFAVPIGFDTDVAGSALAEGRWGASVNCDVHIYVTVGTGLGAGIVVGGKAVHGQIHPEVGHIRVRRSVGDDFPGLCPFHGDCIEGLVAGPAISARAGAAADTLPIDHPVWNRVADELAELMAQFILTVSPERIILGGGVMRDRAQLLPRIRARTAQLLGGYVANTDANDLAKLIVEPGLGSDAGPLGAVALALEKIGHLAQFAISDRPTSR